MLGIELELVRERPAPRRLHPRSTLRVDDFSPGPLTLPAGSNRTVVISWRTSIIGADSSDGMVATPCGFGAIAPLITPCWASQRHHCWPLRTARRSSSSPVEISTRI